MTKINRVIRMSAVAAIGAVVLAGCAGTTQQEENTTPSAQSQSDSAPSAPESPASAAEPGNSPGGPADAPHSHAPDGGPPPEGIEAASAPLYPVGTTVILTADHMPAMAGSQATVSGAFDTTAYSVSYTPTTGGDPVTDHKWVVHEELDNPGDAPLADGTEVVVNADHMAGMEGAAATIDSSTDETVYMVDLDMNGMPMTHHKWVVESEILPAR